MEPPLLIALDVRGMACLVVGGGRVGLRKARGLVECGGVVTVVSPDAAASELAINVIPRAYEPGDCAGFRLVFACTDSREVNARIAHEAHELGIWCNIADATEESDFASLATVRRGEISVGISTGGNSAALAKHLREKIEESIGEEYAELAELLGERRAAFKSTNDADLRAAAWRAVLESGVLQLLRDGDRAAAERRVDEILNGQEERAQPDGV